MTNVNVDRHYIPIIRFFYGLVVSVLESVVDAGVTTVSCTLHTRFLFTLLGD